MRTLAFIALMLFACRDAATDTTTPITRETPTPTASSAAPPAAPVGDAACPLACGPAPKTICCNAHDKCCAEGVAAHFYCYSGPGDCPMRP